MPFSNLTGEEHKIKGREGHIPCRQFRAYWHPQQHWAVLVFYVGEGNLTGKAETGRGLNEGLRRAVGTRLARAGRGLLEIHPKSQG